MWIVLSICSSFFKSYEQNVELCCTTSSIHLGLFFLLPVMLLVTNIDVPWNAQVPLYVSDLRRMNNQAMYSVNTGMIILGGGVCKHHTCNANLMVRRWCCFSVCVCMHAHCVCVGHMIFTSSESSEKDLPYKSFLWLVWIGWTGRGGGGGGGGIR